MGLNRFEWLKAVMQSNVSPAAKNVASVLAVRFANDDTHQINPSRETLADYLKVHRDTIKRAVRELKKAGWLMVLEGRGRGRSNRYTLHSPEQITWLRDKKNRDCAPSKKGGDLHPKAPPKGVLLRKKGGRSALAYKMQEQSSEQEAAERLSSSQCPISQCALIEPGSHHEAAWNNWLSERDWPSVAELDVRLETGWRVPFTMPPSDRHGIGDRISEKYLNWATCRLIERRRSSA